MYECIRLDPKKQPDTFMQASLALLPNHLQISFKEDLKHTFPIAIAANFNGTPVGILFAFYHLTFGFAKVEYVFVSEAHRNKHAGRQLLAAFEKEVKPRTVLELIYPDNELESPAIEKILKANQWIHSRPYVLRCFFQPATFSAPWLNMKFSYPKGCKEFRWKELREKDRKSVIQKEKEGHFPSYLSPLRDEKLIDPDYSLGLRMEGSVVGWVITHRIDPDTVRYSTLYIDHSLRYSGAAIHLLANSIRRLVAAPPPVAVMDVSLSETSSSWVKLVKKRLIPYATKVVTFSQSWKEASVQKNEAAS